MRIFLAKVKLDNGPSCYLASDKQDTFANEFTHNEELLQEVETHESFQCYIDLTSVVLVYPIQGSLSSSW